MSLRHRFALPLVFLISVIAATSAAAAGTIKVRRQALDALLATPDTAGKQVRVVPAIKDGRPHGFKLYAIRAGSLVEAVGFQNGDTLLAVNGLPLTSPDAALAAYTAARQEARLVFDVMRRGKARQIVVVIVD